MVVYNQTNSVGISCSIFITLCSYIYWKNYDSCQVLPLLGNELQVIKKARKRQRCDDVSTVFQSHCQTKWVSLKIQNRVWRLALLFILRLRSSPRSSLTRYCAKILIHSWQKINLVTVSHATISDFISRTRIPSNYLCFPLPLFPCYRQDYSLLPKHIEVGEERVC